MYIVCFLWQHGVMQDLGIQPGVCGTHGFAVNDKGQVVGEAGIQDSSDDVIYTRGFVWHDGVLRTLGFLPGASRSQGTIASSINDKGHTVGHRVTAGGAHHAVLWPPPRERLLPVTPTAARPGRARSP